MNQVLEISPPIIEQVNRAFAAVMPEEGCGFLLGKNGTVTEFHAAENSLHSPVAYQMSPADQIRIMLDAEDRKLDVLAIIHSHPHSPAVLSRTDIVEAKWFGLRYVIVSFAESNPVWRAWFIPADAPTNYEEIPLK